MRGIRGTTTFGAGERISGTVLGSPSTTVVPEASDGLVVAEVGAAVVVVRSHGNSVLSVVVVARSHGNRPSSGLVVVVVKSTGTLITPGGRVVLVEGVGLVEDGAGSVVGGTADVGAGSDGEVWAAT